MSDTFRSVLLEGLFQEVQGRLVVNGTDVLQALAEFKGLQVRVAAHYAPPQPVNPNARGLGCCHWTGHCPAGHHLNPGKMLLVSGSVLMPEEPSFPWLKDLPGHDARLVVATEILPPPPSSDFDIIKLTRDAEALREFLHKLSGDLKETR